MKNFLTPKQSLLEYLKNEQDLSCFKEKVNFKFENLDRICWDIEVGSFLGEKMLEVWEKYFHTNYVLIKEYLER